VAGYEVSVERAADGVPAVVEVSGELDIAAVPEVQRAVAVAEQDRPATLALDLSEVVHVDSSGLRVLLDAAARARSRAGRLVIVAPPGGPVGRLLELTLLADHLEVVRDMGGVAR
jgi:anti-sigma B factor antagonist